PTSVFPLRLPATIRFTSAAGSTPRPRRAEGDGPDFSQTSRNPLGNPRPLFALWGVRALAPERRGAEPEPQEFRGSVVTRCPGPRNGGRAVTSVGRPQPVPLPDQEEC